MTKTKKAGRPAKSSIDRLLEQMYKELGMGDIEESYKWFKRGCIQGRSDLKRRNRYEVSIGILMGTSGILLAYLIVKLIFLAIA